MPPPCLGRVYSHSQIWDAGDTPALSTTRNPKEPPFFNGFLIPAGRFNAPRGCRPHPRWRRTKKHPVHVGRGVKEGARAVGRREHTSTAPAIPNRRAAAVEAMKRAMSQWPLSRLCRHCTTFAGGKCYESVPKALQPHATMQSQVHYRSDKTSEVYAGPLKVKSTRDCRGRTINVRRSRWTESLLRLTKSGPSWNFDSCANLQ